jgi:hypothetical protein
MLRRVLLPAAAVALAGAAVLLMSCGRIGGRRTAHDRLACAGCHREAQTVEGRSSVPNTACGNAGCHTDGGGDTARLVMVTFRHKDHPAPGGGTVPCAACHVHPRGLRTLRADGEACALCHQQQIASDSGCALCHPQPRHERRTSQGIPVSHAAVTEARISCTRCHYQLLDGTGAVAAARCRDCHLDADTTKLIPADSAHATHRDYACTACHGTMRHRIVAMSASVRLVCTDCHARGHLRPIPADTSRTATCDACHRNVHAAQQRLMIGVVPGEPLEPTVMFMGGLSCRSCHARSGAAAPRPGESLRGSDASCVGCHGVKWTGYLATWNRGYARRREWVLGYLRQARTAVSAAGANAGALTRIAQGQAFVAEVDSAKPVHNLQAADELLRRALTEGVQAYRAAGLAPAREPQLGPPARRGSCMSCHYGVEERPAELDSTSGQRLRHADHMFRAALPCEACHAAGAAPPGISDSLWIDTNRLEGRRPGTGVRPAAPARRPRGATKLSAR